MKTVRDAITHAPVWVNPGHTAETAIVLLRGLGFGALPVMEGADLVGIIEYSQLLGAPPATPVERLMTRDVPTIHPDTTVRDAARIMSSSQQSRLPVMDDGRLLGVVTALDLIGEASRSVDPLTMLPWSDSLREWGIAQLEAGREITVLFVDLDRFGRFNKRYGHVIGDAVLQSVSAAIIALSDNSTDSLCRYGGDEFCLGTLRSSEEAADLAAAVEYRVRSIEIPEAAGERISCTVGLAGGKRTREREHVHYAATVNSLINLASRDSIARKAVEDHTSGAESPGPPLASGRVRLVWIDVARAGPMCTVRVDLRAEDATGESILYSETLSGDIEEVDELILVARTTAGCVGRLLAPGSKIQITEVQRETDSRGQRYITVLGEYATLSFSLPIAGAGVITTDPNRAAAVAVLTAVSFADSLVPAPAADHAGSA